MITNVDHAPEEFEVQTWAAEVEDEELRETAEDIVREAGNKAVDAYPSGEKSEPVRILLGRTPEDHLSDNPDKDPLSGIRGFARSFDTIEITYAPVDGWEEHLRGTVAHEYPHTVWIEQRADIHQEGAGWEDLLAEAISTNWQYILFEAQSQNFSEQVYPGVDAPYRDNVPREQIAGEDGWWEVVRDEKLDDPALQRSPLFYGSERVETESKYDFPRWLGYTLSYHIGSQLLGEDDIGIEDFPYLSRDDVVRAENALYG